MSKDIRIRKGLDIKLKGEADKILVTSPHSKVFALRPSDFHGVTPKLEVRVGDEVLAGQTLFHDKYRSEVKFVSPVSGEVVEVKRGEKRRILEVKVLADSEISFKDHTVSNPESLSADQVKELLLSSGCWPFIKQRPYDIIANPEEQPKAIFVSGIDSAPLANDLDFSLKGKESELQTALGALGKLTSGNVHVTILSQSGISPFSQVNGVKIHKATGKHPVGLVSTQIANIDPINKGEIVWVVSAQDLVIIGEFLLTGKYNAERIVSLSGDKFDKPLYTKTRIGAQLESVVSTGELNQNNTRVISGNILTGEKTSLEGFLGYYHNQVTAIEEGDDYDLFGWNKPQPNKFSVSRAMMFSWMTPNKKYALNTNTNGEERAFVLTGLYERVFPLDIYPMQLLKSFLYNDLDEMEALGAYEIAPEDFALTEFVCVSKINHQEIVRKGLDLMIKEIG